MRLIIILSFLLQTFGVYAECKKNVAYIEEGETITAQCDGFFVKSDTMQELKNNDEILKLKEKEIANLKEISLKNEQLTAFYEDRSKFLNEQLKTEERRSFWKGTGMFVLGVIVTGAASYAAIKATR